MRPPGVRPAAREVLNLRLAGCSLSEDRLTTQTACCAPSGRMQGQAHTPPADFRPVAVAARKVATVLSRSWHISHLRQCHWSGHHCERAWDCHGNTRPGVWILVASERMDRGERGQVAILDRRLRNRSHPFLATRERSRRQRNRHGVVQREIWGGGVHRGRGRRAELPTRRLGSERIRNSAGQGDSGGRRLQLMNAARLEERMAQGG